MTQRFLTMSTQRKYRSWAAHCGLVLFISLLLAWIQAVSPASSAGKEAQAKAGADSPAQVDQEVRRLEPGKPIERELAGGQSHSYQITLAAGQYLKLVVEQRGIDVVVKLFGVDGKQITEFDSEIRTQGQEMMSLVADAAGNYRVSVQAKQQSAPVGRYEIREVEIRAATEKDRALEEAHKLHTESRRLSSSGKNDEARSLAERALEIREKALGQDHLDVALSLNNLANLYYDKGDYARAETLYKRALSIREKALEPEHPAVAQSLNDLALLYYRGLGDYAKAEPLYQRALSIREKSLGPDHLEVARSLNNLAVLYRAKGDYAKAEPLYQRALSVQTKAHGPNHLDVGNTYNNLAILYRAQGDYDKAEPFYQLALSIRERALGPDHPAIAVSLFNLAILYDDKGDYAKAEPLFHRALSMREKSLGPNHPEVALFINSLAILYKNKGDYSKAEPLYQRALSIMEKALAPDHPDVAFCLNNLAVIYNDKGDYAKAEPLYQRALSIWEKRLGPNHPDVAPSLNNLAILYRAKGDYSKAEALYQRALSILEKSLGPEHPSIAQSIYNFAGLYKVKGDYAKAAPMYQRALSIMEKTLGPDHSHVASSLSSLALLHRSRGEIKEAITLQARANEISERNLSRNLMAGSERQKLAYLALYSKETNLTFSLHNLSATDDSQALNLAFTTLLRRKGRGLDAMTDAIAALRRNAAPQDQTLFDQLTDLRRQLAVLTLRGPDAANPETYRVRIKPLEEQYEKVEAELSARSAAFRAQSQPVTLAAVQAALPVDSALVEFAVYTPLEPQSEKSKPARYLAYVLPAQGGPKWADLGEAAVIDGAVAAWRKTLMAEEDKSGKLRFKDARPLARELDELIMRPVRSLIGKTQRLLISPDGLLNLIPFAALVDESGEYLVSKYTISYLTSGRDLLRLQAPQKSKSDPLVVANPSFGLPDPSRTLLKPLQPLLASEDEAMAIKTVLPEASLLLREQATEAALKQAKAPWILHVATHGFFFSDQQKAPPPLARGVFGEDPLRMSDMQLSKWAASVKDPLLRSGLALTGANKGKSGDDDGLLTALEAAGMDLWGTKLVVLSACDTGVGEVKNGEGVQGLRRALVLAGSESQVMSLWPVSNEATRDLMIAYYKTLMRGEGRGAALRQIQLQLLRSKNRRHPFYWAAFIQSGEWANLEGKR